MSPHYGKEFLQVLQDDKMYGDLFSYEGYQRLENCDQKNDFQDLWSTTKFKNSPVYDDPRNTYRHLRLQQGMDEWLARISHFFLMGILAIVLIPLFPF